MKPYLIAALYHFVPLPDFTDLREPLHRLCERQDVTGTLLLAREGINGTIAGPEDGIRTVLAYLRSDPRLAKLEHKESWAGERPFYRMKVKLKREIVTMGVDYIDPATMAGEYVKPAEWNELIDDPDVVVVDVRNDYEVAVGTFKSAVNPNTDTFTEFPDWVKQESRPGGVLQGKSKIAMFCTGGIRCEKSTAYLKSQGFDNVYHLHGGILQYLEDVPAEDSLWQGECFVFDERVSVGHGLEVGSYELCRACRMPVSEQDKQSPLFEQGVSCPHCHASLTAERRERLLERQRQIDLAVQRQERHIGVRVEVQKERARARVEAARQRALQKQKEKEQKKQQKAKVASK